MPSFRSRLLALLRGDAGAVCALAALFFGANWQLLAGRVSEHWDSEQFAAPFYGLLSRMARSGRLLLWNPFSAGGSPDFADPNVGALSPLSLLFGLIAGPGSTAFHAYWLSVWLLGGLGMYVLARAIAAPPVGALIVALSFVFSGFYLGHAEHITIVSSFSFVPWVLWRMRAALTGKRLWPAVEAGGIWGLSALSGYPGMTILTAMFVAVLALAWLPARGAADWRRYVCALLLMTAVGAAILAPAFLSFRYETAGYSDRSLPLNRAFALPPQALDFRWLTAFASPMIPLGTYTSPGSPQLDICYLPVYCGALLPILAFFAFWQGRSRWWAWTVAGTGLLFIGLALGNTLPLRAWLYDLLPITRYFRHAPMFRGYFVLAAGMLAASGAALVHERCEREQDAPDGLRPFAWVAALFAAGGIGSFAWIFTSTPVVFGAQFLPAAALHLAIAWGGAALLTWWAACRRPARRSLLGALAILTAIDMTGAFLLSSSVVYRAGSIEAPEPVLPLLDLGPAGFARAVASADNSNLYVQRPAFVTYATLSNRIYTAWGKDLALLRSVVGPRRVWFSPEAPTVPVSLAAFAAFQARVRQAGGLVVLRHERASVIASGSDPAPPDLAAIEAAQPAQALDCRVLRYHANDLSIEVTCPSAGFLMLTDRWSRSWRATVNGQPVPVEGADFLFRLVRVQPGLNRIDMNFAVAWLWPLLALSWTTLAAVGVGSLWKWRQRTRQTQPMLQPSALLPAAA